MSTKAKQTCFVDCRFVIDIKLQRNSFNNVIDKLKLKKRKSRQRN